MSLAPSERRALAGIEDALRNSDPWLAAKLAAFTLLTSRGKIRRRKYLSPWRVRVRRLLLFTVVLRACGLLVLLVALFNQPTG